MIEDALKSTRNLHRLIIAVSLITLVFSLSLDLPPDKIQLKDAIDRLTETNFLAYDAFVQEKVDAYAAQNLAPIAQNVNERLDALGLRIFQLHHIGEALAKPLHVGKLLTAELKDISSATLTELEALNGLDLGRDVQVIKPQTTELMDVLEAFLREHGHGTKRIESVRAGIDDSPFIAETFLPDDDAAIAGLYFELRENLLPGAAPVFNGSFNADIETLPGTSFLHWVQQTLKENDAIAVQGRRLVFLSGLSEIPTGYPDKPLGTLSLDLADEIASKGPEKLSAKILGTEVPGLLIVIASPTILLFLSYYFMQHTAHLRLLVTEDFKAFREFAWLPVALRSDTSNQSNKKPRMIHAWVAETVATTIILPVLAMVVLFVQLDQFGGLRSFHTLLFGGVCFAVILMGGRTLDNIGDIRTQLAHAPVTETRE